MTNKPREFWISLGEECDDIVWRTHPKNEHFNFHVVEYSAYQTLLEQAERMAEALNNFKLQVEAHGGDYLPGNAIQMFSALKQWQEFKK